MSEPVRETLAMIAGMAPLADPQDYLFLGIADAELAGRALPLALAAFREDEGLSLVIAAGAAATLGLAGGPLWRRITLTVHSALDGVGLTAAVAAALTAERIPCNIIAAFHHDHVMVPAADAMRAVTALRRIAAQAAVGGLPALPPSD